MSKPHKCPLCNGTGGRPEGFIEGSSTFTPCHGCGGSGVVWEPEDRNAGEWAAFDEYQKQMDANLAIGWFD